MVMQARQDMRHMPGNATWPDMFMTIIGKLTMKDARLKRRGGCARSCANYCRMQ
jgi:hypothetical protein